MATPGIPKATRHVVVMGVSGTGKTTVGRGLAASLNAVFADADDHHPPANVAKMRDGIPLTDADRMPWLQALSRWQQEQAAAGQSTVLACSALRRTYRDTLRIGLPWTGFVHLTGSRELLTQRLEGRQGHFMPAALLDSQLATLEPLAADEIGLVLDVEQPPTALIGEAALWVLREASQA